MKGGLRSPCEAMEQVHFLLTPLLEPRAVTSWFQITRIRATLNLGDLVT